MENSSSSVSTKQYLNPSNKLSEHNVCQDLIFSKMIISLAIETFSSHSIQRGNNTDTAFSKCLSGLTSA